MDSELRTIGHVEGRKESHSNAEILFFGQVHAEYSMQHVNISFRVSVSMDNPVSGRGCAVKSN